MRACSLPRCPTPTTPTRRRDIKSLSPVTRGQDDKKLSPYFFELSLFISIHLITQSPSGSLTVRHSGGRQLVMQAADQFHVGRMAGTIGDDVAAQVSAQESEVADQIEHLVPRRLVGVTQRVVHRTTRAEDEQVGSAGPRPQTLATQLRYLFFENKGPARG